MADFHRFVTPTYFGGLPGTHDLINVVSGGIGSGDGSAPADGAKAGPHPNEGTYFVAFGENATAADANRGMRALSENTDYLDDVVHADQSLPAITASATPGAPLASVVIAGNVFVGGGSEINDQRTRSGLVAVLDGNGVPLHVLSSGVYVPILVNKIHNGSGTSVVGTDYYVNPTVDFSPSIPTGQSYRLVHYTRGTLVSQASNAYTRLANGFRGEEELWAYAKTTKEGTATFTGDKTFSDTVTFDDLVSALSTIAVDNIDSTAPLLSTDTAADDDSPVSAYKLLFKFKLATASSVLVRVYSKPSFLGCLITVNAKWDQPTARWIADHTANNAIRVSFNEGSPVSWESKNQTTPANWVDNAWNGTVGAGANLSTPLMAVASVLNFNFLDATLPFIASDKAPQDHPGVPGNTWKLASTFTTSNSDAIKVRIYVGSGLARLALTVNAVWDPATSLWSSDLTTSKSTRLAILDSSTVSQLRLTSHIATAGTWVENAWDSGSFDVGSLVGTLSIGGEFKYLNARTYIVPLNGFQPITEGAGWVCNTVSLSPTTAPCAATWVIPRIPQGMHLTGMRCTFDPGGAGTVLVEAVKITHNLDGAAIPTSSVLDSTVGSGAGRQTVSLSMNELIDNVAHEYILVASCSNAADTIYSIEYTIG